VRRGTHMSELFSDTTLPVAFIEPWLADNAQYVQDISRLGNAFEHHVPRLRSAMEDKGVIRKLVHANRVALGAVDASVVEVELCDQVNLLFQVVRVADDGQTRLGKSVRKSGVSGHQIQLVRTPLRMMLECEELAATTNEMTIADNSFWSFLMEANQAITNATHSNNSYLAEAVTRLVDEGVFIDMLQNRLVIAMSKRSESDSLVEGVSDRTMYELILNEGEFVRPMKITDGTRGSFGIERRRFSDGDRQLINEIYHERLGVMFFKPHSWSRAFRIEGYLDKMRDDAWLMPLLNAIAHHTATRTIVEPWPQFMADFTAKKLSAMAPLYGSHNRHRLPILTAQRTAL